MSRPGLPTLRWGIVATGLISSWFVSDLALPRPDAKAKHVIQAIGSSSMEKGQRFAKDLIPSLSPTIYSSYSEVYADSDVDIVYIGTPHAFHARNCLDAIAAGKHVLCEKPFALTASEAEEVFSAAAKRGVFVMEAMWTRLYPLMRTLQSVIHEEKLIGKVQRVFCDFSLDMDIEALGLDSRLKNPALGAGSLLDIGIYSLTWGLLALDRAIGEEAQKPRILAAQTLSNDIDVASSMILSYPTGAQAILTSSLWSRTDSDFCRIEGTEGHIVVSGPGSSAPQRFVVHSKSGNNTSSAGTTDTGKIYEFEKPGHGFYFEADAVALDIAAGRVQNSIMPWKETVRVMRLLDEVRRQGGARFPQDKAQT
ncbi:dimeric dihydrodiol dehydrogenase [Boeremia exigua]|uniref:dimeric dihydrodiol dehydrogenase n=1 Tax=Boeremia exigua TaxID=749465 RepID=UPI001E8DC5CF|nr:dimeric dihydrodiol dehydrogenase [Boeremia exigua]KAH6611695.1 dimeric dihydrodiol dehydrogenase [Boeremia exigua]